MGKIYEKLKCKKRSLYHVTEFENLESILQNGLLSLRTLDKKHMKVSYVSKPISREVDRSWSLDKYVRLAYTPYYDMIPANIYGGYIKNPVVLYINPSVLLDKIGILYTDKNAAAKEANFFHSENEVYEYLDFRKIYTVRNKNNYIDEIYKNARQAEVLIPNLIESKYITKIIVEDNMDTNFLEKKGIVIEKRKLKEMLELH